MLTRMNKGTPLVVLLYIAAAALLIILGFVERGAQGRFGANAQLLAEPAATGGGVTIRDIESFRDEDPTLITYEVRRKSQASAIRQSKYVNVVGTNSVYASVMGYPIIDGGFFTQAAYDAGAREAVLNELAAAALFGGGRVSGGSVHVNGDLWTVVGVIVDDGDADIIYVPATSDLISGDAGAAQSGQQVSADSLMVLLKNYGAGATAMATSTLRDLGVSENMYSFVRLGKAIGAIGEMADVARRFTLTALLCLFVWFSARAAYGIIRAKIDEAGHSEIAPQRRGGYAKAVAHIIFGLICLAGALYFARQIVELCVTWQEIPLVFMTSPSKQGAFYGRLDAVSAVQARALGLFAASAAVSLAAQIAAALVFGDGGD